ncbi:MAG: hypothetical protein IPN68_18755 [Bacteroidetes bacterium]|nr:hypothetical protein [Bacteroidota bacterium]
MKNIYSDGKGKEKYDKVIGLLRKADPVLASGEEIEREVIKSISGNTGSKIISDAVDFLLAGSISVGSDGA